VKEKRRAKSADSSQDRYECSLRSRVLQGAVLYLWFLRSEG